MNTDHSFLFISIGKEVMEFVTKSAVRTCGYSYSGNMVAYSTDKTMGQPSELLIYDMRDNAQVRKYIFSRTLHLLAFTLYAIIVLKEDNIKKYSNVNR